MAEAVSAAPALENGGTHSRIRSLSDRSRRLVIYFPPAVDSAVSNAGAFAQRIAVATRVTSANNAPVSVVERRTKELGVGISVYQLRHAGSSQGERTASELILDVVEFDYRTRLLSGLHEKSRMNRLLAALIATLTVMLRWPTVWLASMLNRRGERDRRGPRKLRILPSLQLFLALLLVIVLCIYVLLLIAAVASLIPSILGSDSAWVRLLQGATVGIAAVSGLIPAPIRQAIDEFGARWAAILNYLSTGTGRDAVIGNFETLVVEARRAGYEQISVVSYSLGAVIAVDVLFPPSTSPVAKAYVDNLITIGFPHDAITQFFPSYFDRRSCPAGHPGTWKNVLNPVDILSSNFRADSAIYSADEGPAPSTVAIADLRPENVVWNPLGQDRGPTLFQVLSFAGLRSHGRYWDTEGFSGDHGCLINVLDVLMSRNSPR